MSGFQLSELLRAHLYQDSPFSVAPNFFLSTNFNQIVLKIIVCGEVGDVYRLLLFLSEDLLEIMKLELTGERHRPELSSPHAGKRSQG